MKYNEQIITIKRRIKINNDDKLKSYLFDNCIYRNQIYNDFVDAVNDFESKGNNLRDFSPRNYAVFYYNEIESKNPNYKYYASGIRAGVSEDINKNIKIVLRDRIKYDKPEIVLKHKQYDPFRMSFSFENKREERRITYNAKTRIFSPYEVYITFNKEKVLYPIILKEPILSDKTPFLDNNGDLWYYEKNENFIFREKDIKKVIFTYEINNFYISIVTKVKFIKNNKNSLMFNTAGIDLGIHNPVTICDNNGFHIIQMSQKEIDVIERLEERSKRLKSILLMKYECNMKKVNEGLLSTPYSKNYRKVQEKLRITNMKIHNIRKNWILQTCSKIAKEYDAISVDTFNQPNNGYSYTSKIKKMNYYNRNHAMYDFNEILKYLSHKYYCTYISSPEYSTRTCSNCGYINVKLDLSKRYLKCKKMRNYHR